MVSKSLKNSINVVQCGRHTEKVECPAHELVTECQKAQARKKRRELKALGDNDQQQRQGNGSPVPELLWVVQESAGYRARTNGV